MKRHAFQLAAAGLLLASASSAQADFEVCNQSYDQPLLWSHVSYKAACERPCNDLEVRPVKTPRGVGGTSSSLCPTTSPYWSSAWFEIAPGACKVVHRGDARGECFYYVVLADGSQSLPPSDYGKHLFAIPWEGHTGCLLDVRAQQRRNVPHYRFQTLDANTRIAL